MNIFLAFALFAGGWGACFYRSVLWGWVLDGVAWVWGKVNR